MKMIATTCQDFTTVDLAGCSAIILKRTRGSKGVSTCRKCQFVSQANEICIEYSGGLLFKTKVNSLFSIHFITLEATTDEYMRRWRLAKSLEV